MEKILVRFVKKGKYPSRLGWVEFNEKGEAISHLKELEEGDEFMLPERYAFFDWWEPVDPEVKTRIIEKMKERGLPVTESGAKLEILEKPHQISPKDFLGIAGIFGKFKEKLTKK